MRWVTNRAQLLVMLLVATAAVGCATSMYKRWGDQLSEIARANGRPEDVSMMLGTPPSRCESIPNPPPTIGIFLEPDRLVIRSVLPNGPAAMAGIRPGDEILSIDGQPISSRAQMTSAIRSPRDGQSRSVVTTRGTRSVVPRVAKTEQCYWEVQAGQVARSSGAAYVNQYGGSAGAGSAAYQRFFRASCRIVDGVVGGCQANWQQ